MFRIVFISLSLFLSPAYAVSELFVPPVGQGNGVIVRHSPEDGSSPSRAIIVDLGSKALGFSAFYTSRSRREEKTFILGSVEKKAETEALRRAVGKRREHASYTSSADFKSENARGRRRTNRSD